MKRSIILTVVILCTVILGNQAIVYANVDDNDPKWNINLATGLVTSSNAGLKFRKIHSIAGKNDVIHYTSGLQLSPNGKFLLQHNRVVPFEKGDVCKLVDFPAIRSSWSPDGKKIAFYSGGIWLIPVSPETGRATGPAKKIVDGDYWYKTRVQWAPDSARIAFHSNDGQIHIISVSDGSRTQITNDGIFRVQGTWSPNGRHIACRHPGGGVSIVPAKGGDPKKLVETKGGAPCWSPDGKWIIYQRSERLQFVRVSDTAQFDITLPKEVGQFISQSSDGNLLFYKPSYEWTDTLKIISASGGKPVDPTRGHIFQALVQQWSPDGKFIITWGMHNGKWVNWIVPTSGEDPYPLQLDVSIEGELDQGFLSPDSKKLVFSSKSPGGQIRYWIAPVSLMSGKASGLVTKVFDKGEVQDISHRWSHDGSKLLFLFEKDLWLSRTDGSGAVQLTETAGRQVMQRRYSCSPDGSAVAWVSYSPSTRISVLRMRRLSEDKTLDIVSTSKFIRHRWSPDSSRIAYELYGPEETATRELFVIGIPDGESKKLIDVNLDEYHTSFDHQWSPSGESLALVVGRKLLLFNLPDYASRQIGSLIDPVLGRCYGMAWSPDGKALALTMEEKPGQSHQEESGTRVLTVTVPGGTWAELDGEPGYNYSVKWSPDGKWISYDSEEYFKARPEGILWELDVNTYLEKMDRKYPEKSGS